MASHVAKNTANQTYSCPRDPRFSAIMCAQLRDPLKPPWTITALSY